MQKSKIKSCLILAAFLLLIFLWGGEARAAGILISEIMHGKSDCASCEFIELYNPTGEAIDLKNLPEGNGELKIQFISSTGGITNRTINWTRNILPARSYFLFISSAYSDFLSQADATVSYGLTTNSGIIITTSNNTSTIDQIQPLGVELNQSLERNLTTYQFFTQANPNPQNSLWVEEISQLEQTQPVEEQNTAQETSSSSTIQTETSIIQPELTQTQTSIQTQALPQDQKVKIQEVKPGDILINEFLPDPNEGENEWIELFNNTSQTIDLFDWEIEDNTGKIYGSGRGTKKLSQIAIAPNSYFLLKKGEHFNFSLNNSGDVIILKQAGTIIDSVAYGDFESGSTNSSPITNWPKPAKGVSLARTTDGFVLSTSPTPGQPNLIEVIKPESQKVIKSESQKVKESESQEVNESESQLVPRSFSEEGEESSIKKITDLTFLRKLERDERVEIEGMVAVPPGIFGKTIFYLDGLQIYLHSQNFPVLKVGDNVHLIGLISKIDGETRIKVKDKTDIKILASGKTLFPKKVSFEEIGLSLEGRLISVKGQIIERKDNKIYLIDDEDNEVLIFLKESTGINKSQFKEGQYLEVFGVLSQTKSGWRILPRFETDLKMIETTENAESLDYQLKNQPKEIADNQKSPKENKTVAAVSGASNKFTPAKYLIISAITLLVILIALIIKLKFLV